MNRIRIFRSFCAVVAGLLLAGISQSAQLPPNGQGQGQCSSESKNQYYKDFFENHEGDSKNQAKALEAAKKYLACPEGTGDYEENLAQLNRAVGRLLSLKESSNEAVRYLIRAASYNSTVKTSPQTYAYLAEAYELGPYAKLADAYKSRFEGRAETNESLLELENIYQIIDRIIDAYARAVALAGVEVPKQTSRFEPKTITNRVTDWIDSLISFYKFRHKGSEAGLKEMISSILSQPLPAEPIPLTSLPARAK